MHNFTCDATEFYSLLASLKYMFYTNVAQNAYFNLLPFGISKTGKNEKNQIWGVTYFFVEKIYITLIYAFLTKSEHA